MSGLLIALPHEDCIVFDDTTSALHAQTTQLHELGHLVFGHHVHGSGANEDSILQVLFPDFDPAWVRCALTTAHHRDGYADVHEVEAEVFAEVVASRASARRALACASELFEVSDEGIALERLATVLGA